MGYLYNSQTLEGAYVSGVSLAHGQVCNRQHLWTYAAGISEQENGYSACPCDSLSIRTLAPDFIGLDYICESRVNTGTLRSMFNNHLFVDDPLWDGEGCTPNSTCCQFNNPPWFTRNLRNPTTDDIKLRLCTEGFRYAEDIA